MLASCTLTIFNNLEPNLLSYTSFSLVTVKLRTGACLVEIGEI